MRNYGLFRILLLMFSFSCLTSITAEDKQVRLTIPPERIPDPAWRREFFEGTLPLKNRPQIISRKKVQDEIHVVLQNTGQTTLIYRSAGPEFIQTYQEIFRRGLWRKANWDWCGTGKTDYSILPGQSVQLVVRFSDEERGERLLGKFIEAGTKRCGLIVLATETSPDD
ncbi:hypothetical protein [Gimesia sp.]|uniref:hypothetical protein n=1 Tax=Gimesia sp. TaxID=2024833 RepID=UPI003A93AD82